LSPRRVYEEASLPLVDGQPLIWLSRMMGEPFPQKISGSDFVPELMRLAAHEHWRVFFLGATIAIGAGATLDFAAGNTTRSPTWMSARGFEWLYRPAREPRGLAHRDPVRDPEIVKIAWRALRSARHASQGALYSMIAER
jgi:UDP-N-acetyl-D-mannosaminuronic acid transferase (WecB/TagA/CpsF family)